MGRAEHLRPSSAATWTLCTGNAAMRAAFPDAPDEAESEVTEDGTACHWLASEVWVHRFHKEGTLAPNGRVLTEEMFDAVDLYHDVLRSVAWQGAETYCEQAVKCDLIYPGMVGTPDAWTYMPKDWNSHGRLRVVDLKFGFRFVEVWDNLQLICYAASLAHQLQLPPDTLIELVIVQPRSYHRDGHVRTWTTTLAALATHIEKLQNAARDYMEHRVIYTPNAGCRDCPGRHVCVAFHNAAMIAMETSYTSAPFELPPAALAQEMRMVNDALKKLEARKTGLDAQADNLLRKGTMIPGWVLAGTFAREGWREGTESEVITLADKYFGKDITKPTRAITPAQARKIIPATIVAMYAHKPSTGVKLVQQDPYEARKAFEQPTNGATQ